MNTTGDGFACDACPRGRSTNGETGYAVCSRCSELNSPAEEGFDSVTKCFNRMQCGKVSGDYYQNQKGAETCQSVRIVAAEARMVVMSSPVNFSVMQ